MKKFVSKLRESTTFKKTLNYIVQILMFGYVFSIPAFSNRTSAIHYVAYVLMIALGLFTLIYSFLYTGFKIKWPLALIPAFAVFSIFGTLMYSKEHRSILTLVLLASSFFVFIFSFNVLNNKNRIITIVSLAVTMFAIYFIIVYRAELLNFNSYTRDDFRLGFYFDNPNGVAATCVLGFAASLYLLLFLKSKLKYLYLLPILLIGLVGFSTGSRTFLLAVIIFLLSMIFIKFKRHKLPFFIILGALIILAAILINMPFSATLKFRIINAFETIFGISTKADTSTLSRFAWMQYGFEMGSKNLIFGYGAGGFGIFSGVGTYAHSNFAEVLCDFGLIGFILFYAPLFICGYLCVKNKFRNASFVIPFIIYYLIVSFTNVYYYNKLYYLVIAFLFYLGYEEKQKETKLSRILFTCDGMESGGAEKVISVLSNELENNGIEVTILGISTHNPESFYKLNDKVNYQIIHANTNEKIKAFKRVSLIRKFIKKNKPDIVVSFLPHVNVYTSVACFGLNVPHVVSERNNPYVDPKGKLLRALKKYAFSTADGAVFQTNDSKHFYSKSLQKRSVVIKNPIMLNISSFELPLERRKRILFVGRLVEQKNVKNLIDAFDIFFSKHNDYELAIYGEGILKDELVEYANTKTCKEKVLFLGNSSNWHQDEYNDAMFVLPSDYEGMPNALMEALALQMPCVSTDCPSGGPKELIQDKWNGYLCQINDPLALSDKMELCLKNTITNRFAINNSGLIDELNSNSITSQWSNYFKMVINNYDNE